jgi:hypothetical protein
MRRTLLYGCLAILPLTGPAVPPASAQDPYRDPNSYRPAPTRDPEPAPGTYVRVGARIFLIPGVIIVGYALRRAMGK